MVQQGVNETGSASSQPQQAPSILRMVNSAHKHLEHLLFNIHSEPNVQMQILDIAKSLIIATNLNREIALGCIFLNQTEGSYAVRHCVDSAVVALLLARELDKSPNEILTIMAATLTMNIGMLQHQEQLQSRLSAISDRDIALIHRHPQEGVNVLTQAGIDDVDWLSFVLLHHENEDGSGYPSGKIGEEIPLSAKIISLADRYCARVSSRRYRKSLLPNEALSDILLSDYNSIDPMLTTCFIKVLGIYPTGATVRLKNGEIGVISGSGSSTNTPIVRTLVGSNGAPLYPPAERDTSNEHYSISEMLTEEQAGVRFSMQQVWGEQARP